MSKNSPKPPRFRLPTRPQPVAKKVVEPPPTPPPPPPAPKFEVGRLAGLTNAVYALDRALEGYKEPPVTLAFSRDHLSLASGDERVANVWDIATGRFKPVLGENCLFNLVALSPDGKLLVSPGPNLSVKIWKATWRRIKSSVTGHTNDITALAFSSDGNSFATGGRDGQLKRWDTATGRLLRAYQGHYDAVNEIAFTPDSSLLASVGREGTLKLFETQSGNRKTEINLSTNAIRFTVLSADAPLLACGEGSRVAILEIARTAWSPPIQLPAGNTLSGLAVTTDGLVATATTTGNLLLWEACTAGLILTIPAHTNAITALALAVDGRHIATAGADKTVKVWTRKNPIPTVAATNAPAAK